VAQHQQLLRLDWERQGTVSTEEVEALVQRLAGEAPPQVIILSDYGKGFLRPETVRALISTGRELGVPVLVDPKSPDLSVYRGASVVTPNRRELAAMAGGDVPAIDEPGYVELARHQVSQAGIEALVVTLGEHGVLVVPAQGEACPIRSTSQEVYDVTGAGDTFIAVLALALAAGLELRSAARVATAAAGVVVAKFGTAVVRPDELTAALAIAPPAPTRVWSDEALLRQVATWRRQGKRVAFTNGCFDVLHAGHLALLRFAAAQADRLIVGINDDASVRGLKGPGRPCNVEAERSELVAALDCVSAVVLFSEDTPLRLIQQLRPDVLVKGADYALEDVVGREVVEASGGRVALAPLVPERSTSRLIEKLQEP